MNVYGMPFAFRKKPKKMGSISRAIPEGFARLRQPPLKLPCDFVGTVPGSARFLSQYPAGLPECVALGWPTNALLYATTYTHPVDVNYPLKVLGCRFSGTSGQPSGQC